MTIKPDAMRAERLMALRLGPTSENQIAWTLGSHLRDRQNAVRCGMVGLLSLMLSGHLARQRFLKACQCNVARDKIKAFRHMVEHGA